MIERRKTTAFGRFAADLVAVLLVALVLGCQTEVVPGEGTVGFSIPREGRLLDLSYRLDTLLPGPSPSGPAPRSTRVRSQHAAPAAGCPVADLPAGLLMGPVVMLDLRNESIGVTSLAVTVDRVQDWEDLHGPIPSGALVILQTGWSVPDRRSDREPAASSGWPGLGLAAVQFLIGQRGVHMLGTDAPGLAADPAEQQELETLLFAAGGYLVENLTQLDALPARGALLIVAPLPLAAPEAPARVLAVVPRTVGRG